MAGNKVTFGLEKVHVAFLKEGSTTLPEWEAPVHIPGAVSFTPTPQGGENTFYADNGPFFTHTTNNGYTAELSMANLPDEILAEMLGWEIDSNGMLVEVTDGKPREFALLGQVLGDQKNRRFVYYRCKAARPSKEFSTKTETATPNPDNLTITILPIEINGRNYVKGHIEPNETNQAVYDAFFNAVLLPNALPPSGEE